MHTVSTLPSPDANLRSLALILAARSGADWRTCLRALVKGPAVIRTASVREAIVRELAALAVSPPGDAPSPSNAEGVPPTKESTPAAESEIVQ